jgi:phage baseplate assembly protein W
MASAKETDLNPDTFIGLTFPLRKGQQGFFNSSKTSLEQSTHNVRNLLLTLPGERVGQPTFGSNLKAMIFEQMDEELPGRVEEEIRTSVETWLPYIEVHEVSVLTDDGDENKLFVDVRFSTSLDRDKENSVMLNFETGPG